MPLFGKSEGRVPLNGEVISKCKCDVCLVQAQSACARPKIEKMVNMKGMSHMSHEGSGMPGMSMSLAQGSMENMKVNPKDIAGPYCASGTAVCKDLDLNKSCICPTCQVYKDYQLTQARPMEHFCFNDKAV